MLACPAISAVTWVIIPVLLYRFQTRQPHPPHIYLCVHCLCFSGKPWLTQHLVRLWKVQTFVHFFPLGYVPVSRIARTKFVSYLKPTSQVWSILSVCFLEVLQLCIFLRIVYGCLGPWTHINVRYLWSFSFSPVCGEVPPSHFIFTVFWWIVRLNILSYFLTMYFLP